MELLVIHLDKYSEWASRPWGSSGMRGFPGRSKRQWILWDRERPELVKLRQPCAQQYFWGSNLR